MDYHGKGVRQDYAKAIELFRKAAEQGMAGAQSNLGLMFDEGMGGDASLVNYWRDLHGDIHAQFHILHFSWPLTVLLMRHLKCARHGAAHEDRTVVKASAKCIHGIMK